MKRKCIIETLVMISLLAENLAKQLIAEEELEKHPVIKVKVKCRKKEAHSHGNSL